MSHLQQYTINVDSIAKFKTELRKRKDISQVHYEIGPRKLNIILTQLRCIQETFLTSLYIQTRA
jgi:hypothetical protein